MAKEESLSLADEDELLSGEFTVETGNGHARHSIYKFGLEDDNGWRDIAKPEASLPFPRCKVKRLETGHRMLLTTPDGKIWRTRKVVSIDA